MAAALTKATGTAERTAAEEMIVRHSPGASRIALHHRRDERRQGNGRRRIHGSLAGLERRQLQSVGERARIAREGIDLARHQLGVVQVERNARGAPLVQVAQVRIVGLDADQQIDELTRELGIELSQFRRERVTDGVSAS